MSEYRRGDVVLVPFPFADLSSRKQRPAVVVSGELYHNTEPDIIIAAITSRIRQPVAPTDYVLQDWEQAGLLRPSLVKASLATIEPELVRYRIGRVTDADLIEIGHRLARALELTD